MEQRLPSAAFWDYLQCFSLIIVVWSSPRILNPREIEGGMGMAEQSFYFELVGVFQKFTAVVAGYYGSDSICSGYKKGSPFDVPSCRCETSVSRKSEGVHLGLGDCDLPCGLTSMMVRDRFGMFNDPSLVVA